MVDQKTVDELSSVFPRAWEPVFHWRTMASMLLGLSGLRATWPMSSVSFQQPECTDISGHGNHLQASAALGNVTFGRHSPRIVPVAIFSGAANSYLLRADGGAGNWADIGIAGGDLQITGAQRGLSLGGWFWWSAIPGAGQYLIAKDDVGANRQYRLILFNAAGNVAFDVWAGPVSVVSGATIVAGWNHIVGLYDRTNQDLHVVLNGVVTTNAGAAPAALVDTGAPLTIGASGAGGTRFTGYASDCFLCAAFIGTSFARALFHHTKAAYGVK